MSVHSPEHELLANAISGDRAALERLLLDQYNRLSRHVAPKIPAPLRGLISVEDIVQQTFVQACRNIGEFESRSDESFSAWLKTIADNCLRDSVKAFQRKKRGGGHRRVSGPVSGQSGSIADLVEVVSDRGHSPSRSVARREAVRAVQVGLASLPSDQRRAIELRYLKGNSVPETAALMNRTPGAVRGLIHRAKQSLRNTLGRSSLWLSKKQ